jgi:hypothetical protein
LRVIQRPGYFQNRLSKRSALTVTAPQTTKPLSDSGKRHTATDQRKFFSSQWIDSEDDRTLTAPTSHFDFLDQRHCSAQINDERFQALHIRKSTMASKLPTYLVRHLAGNFEELSCFMQLEDESAAMYFNIVHGSKLRRKSTTENSGKRCEDYVLIAREIRTDGSMEDRAVAFFDLS